MITIFRSLPHYPYKKTHGGKETTEALEALATGKIDIVIGTHKLLQDYESDYPDPETPVGV